jgi:DNA-directed RNA polymerase II subunit RPB1
MKTPIMNIYLSPPARGASSEDLNVLKPKCMEVMNCVRTIRLKDVVKTCKIYFDPDNLNTQIVEDRGFMQLYQAFAALESTCRNVSNWLLRFEFDRAKMLDFQLSMIDIHDSLTDFYDDSIQCLFSDDNAENLVMRVKLNMDKGVGSDDVLTELRALEHNLLEVVSVRGVPGIERVSLHEETNFKYRNEDGTFAKQVEWAIDTEGSSLKSVLALPYVDCQRTLTNNIPEVYEVLGIEAARNALYNEIMDVLDSVGVNYRHVALLVDTMTNKGHLLSIDRHGINRGDIGPLAKCSFEEVNDMLIKAGMHAETDRINGVSANIILGQIAPCGTGDTKVLMDEYKLAELNVEAPDSFYPQESEEDAVDHDVTACGEQALQIKFDMPAAGDAPPEPVQKRKVQMKVID